MKRPTADERMDAWLNHEADRLEIPDEDRRRYTEHLRNTSLAAGMRCRFAVDDAWEATGCPRLIRRLLERLVRP